MLIDIEHLAKLARINLTDEEKKRFHGELEKILDHFKELEKLNTEGVKPMTGGTELKDVVREDLTAYQTENELLADAFPDKKDSYLRVPGIFDESDE